MYAVPCVSGRCRSAGRQIKDDRSQHGTILANDFAFALAVIVAAKYRRIHIESRRRESQWVSQFPNLELISDSASVALPCTAFLILHCPLVMSCIAFPNPLTSPLTTHHINIALLSFFRIITFYYRTLMDTSCHPSTSSFVLSSPSPIKYLSLFLILSFSFTRFPL